MIVLRKHYLLLQTNQSDYEIFHTYLKFRWNSPMALTGDLAFATMRGVLLYILRIYILHLYGLRQRKRVFRCKVNIFLRLDKAKGR